MNSTSKASRRNKGNRTISDKTSTANVTNLTDSSTLTPGKDKGGVVGKVPPTAEQLRIAQMIDSSKSEPDKVLQEKINQVMQLTAASCDDAMIALHDCSHDVNAAVEFLLEGEDRGKWLESSKKKKKTVSPILKLADSENKENRRVEERERSNSRHRGSGPPRFHGRGSGRGATEDLDGAGGHNDRSYSRRGRFSYGGPGSRGRSGRGRGGSHNSRTFQNRQTCDFSETIDTWDSSEKFDDKNDLKIDTWNDDDPSSNTEEWEGSLDHTTIFGSSKICDPSEPVAAAPYSGSSLSESLMVEDSSISSQAFCTTHSVGSGMLPEPKGSPMDLSVFLQKSGQTQSSLGSLTNSAVTLSDNLVSRDSGSGTLPSSVLGPSSIMGGLNMVRDNLSVLGENTVSNVASSLSEQYSSSNNSIQNSVFSAADAAISLSSTVNDSTSHGCLSDSKSISIADSSNSLHQRNKNQRVRMMPNSKIPQSAVEMPEDAMAALDVKFSGLEFGAENFDFTSDVKMQASTVSLCGSTTRLTESSSISASKEMQLPSLTSALTHPSKLAPDSLSYPSTQASERKPPPSSNTFVTTGTRHPSSQILADLKESTSVGLDSFVGSSSTSPYHPTYGSSKSFPPPSVPFSSNPSQSFADSTTTVVSSNVGAASASNLSSQVHSVQTSKTLSGTGKGISSLGSAGSHHPQQLQHQALSHQQQAQQQQQAHQMITQHSPYVAPTALQGALPTAFYGGLQQQPTLYSLEELQFMHQRLPPMQQPPTTLTNTREGSLTSSGTYSSSDGKFRTDQNSSPIPSTVNQQGAATAGGAYITATGNAPMPPPIYMYHGMAAVPSTYPQYGAPTIFQMPSNTHTGSSATQFPGPPKLQYGTTANYYDNVSQDFKSSYGSPSQSKVSSGSSASNSAADLSYKNHLKVNRPVSYEKPGFHTGTPPPFNLAGTGTNPMTASAYPMFIQPMPQHHSTTLLPPHLQPDVSTPNSQRSGSSSSQVKGGSKSSYVASSFWASS